MRLEKVLIDTNLYVEWLNDGRHEHLMLGPGFVRYLSVVVHMARMLAQATRLERVGSGWAS